MTTISTAQRRHSEYYLRKLHDFDSQYRKGGAEASQALASFTSEWDQCKQGQAYAAEWIGQQDWGTDFSIGYAIAGTLLLTLQFPPYQRIEWLECGLHASKLKGQISLEAEIWEQLGSANDARGDWKTSVGFYRESLKKVRVLNDREREGRILGSLGLVYMMLGDHDEARINFEKALAIARELGDRLGEGRHLGSLGLISRVPESIHYFEQALRIARENRDHEGEISHLGCLGMGWLQSRDRLANTRIEFIHPNIRMRNTIPQEYVPEDLKRELQLENLLRKAEDCFHEAVMIAREIGNSRAEARHLGNLGQVRSQQGEIEAALNCYKAALAISEHIGDHQNQVKQLKNMKSAYGLLHDKLETRRIEARLKEVCDEAVKPDTENILEKFGSKVVDPFHEDYWRASREKEIENYWSQYYSIHIGE